MEVKGYKIEPSADLSEANLRGADLFGAYLRVANLSRANLCGADLSEADLRGAYLRGADLFGANLRGANLSEATLCGADLCGANLCEASLREADLDGANLCGANLREADLFGANLRGANLSEALMPPLRLPEGALIGYKKLQGGVVCKLRIPEEAKRSASWVGNKLRAEYAIVLDGSGVSSNDGHTVYEVGKTVYPDKYDDDPRVECTNGIHFFLTRQEAEDY